MSTTSLTLLDRLRQNRPEDWERFVRLYAPMILRWARQQGLQPADADDLAQDVLVRLVRLLPTYQRGVGQSFRGWLCTVTRNECHDFRRHRARRSATAAADLEGVPAPHPADDITETEYRATLLRRGMELIRGDFGEETWRAFAAFVLEGQPAAAVAAALQMTTSAVYAARHRILARLRHELEGLVE